MNGYPTADTKKYNFAEIDEGRGMEYAYKQERFAKPRGRQAAAEPATLDEMFNSQKNKADSFVDLTIASIQSRFDLTEKQVIAATKIMHIKFMPLANDEAFANYGDEAVRAFVRHFQSILILKGCDVNKISSEWDDAKFFIKEQKQLAPLITDAELWVMVLKNALFFNFSFVIIIMMCLPTTTADCERGFSLMKRFKTALRSRLGIRFVSSMMAVKLNTADEEDFDPRPFVESWWEKKARRMGGDGNKKRKAPEQQEELTSENDESEVAYYS